MPILRHHGLRLHWETQGSGSPLLLIMGHRYSSRLWYPALDALTQHHRVILFDNRGVGGSGYRLRTSIADLAGDALAVMDAAGAASAHVYGVSMGGGIALELALQQPARVRSLVLGGTAIWSREKRRLPRWVRLLYYVPPPLLRLALRRRRADQAYGSAASADAIARDRSMIDSDPYAMLGVAAQAGAIARHVCSHEQVATLTMPSLVLHGDEDRVVPYRYGEELADTLPDARLITLNGAGHNYYIAAAGIANRAVLDFLRRADS